MKKALTVILLCLLLSLAFYGCKGETGKENITGSDPSVYYGQNAPSENENSSLANGEEEDDVNEIGSNNTASGKSGAGSTASSNGGATNGSSGGTASGGTASNNGSSSSDNNSTDNQSPTVEFAHENDGEWGASVKN